MLNFVNPFCKLFTDFLYFDFVQFCNSVHNELKNCFYTIKIRS